MMKKRFLSRISAVIAAAVALSCLPFIGAAKELPYVETVFNERSGLPTGEANDVLQTSDGYVWVGSYGGLIRYDGTEFRNFSSEGILPSSSVRMMYEDEAGRLWIGTNDAGVFLFENDKVIRPEGQPKDNFLCIRGFTEHEGVIYVCSNSGVAEIRDGKMTVYDIPEIAGQIIYSIGADKFGRVWGATSRGGCAIIKDGAYIGELSGEKAFGDNSVYSVTSGKNGEIWLGSSSNSLAEISLSDENIDNIIFKYHSTGSVSVHNSLRMMKDGTLCICGLHGFGALYENGALREFSENDGAASVNSAFIDYEGNVWLASTSLGIVRFSLGCFSNENRAAKLEGIALNAVAVENDIKYIGCDSGLIICDKNWSRIENDLTKMFSNVRVRDIAADASGAIWIASYSDFPVVRYDASANEIKTFSAETGLCGNRARVILPLSDGRTAIGTQSGISVIGRNGACENYTEIEYPAILSLLETEDGALLAGSDGGGIYEIKDRRITNHGFSEGLSEGVVLRMLRDEKGAGYFISAGSSLYYWESGAFRKLESLKKEAGSIFDLYLDGDRLWLLQNSGILSADREDLVTGGTGAPTLYGFDYGLSGSLNANTRHCLKDGRLYLVTRDGLNIFGFEVPENTKPKAIINSVTIDGEVFEHPEKIEIPKAAQRVTIDLAVLSFTGTTPINISYRLEGFDKEDITLAGQKNGTASYTNLPGGNYTLRLKVNGEEELSLSLEKEKKLTEMPLFGALTAVATVLAVTAIVWLIASRKLRRERARKKAYHDIVEQALRTFAGTIDAKDKYTNGHSTRVAAYSRELSKRMGMTEEQQENIFYVALMHDIGKIGIPDSILKKPDKLTDEEWAIIRTHPTIGAEILENFTALDGISDGAKYHHERYDGKGYCEGIAGEDIPLTARIICVADTYDTMSGGRVYRKPLTKDEIISEFTKGSGTQFDPAIVPLMLDMIKEGVVPIKTEKAKTFGLGESEEKEETDENEKLPN